MPKAVGHLSPVPSAGNPVRELTAYELRNLVAHLAEAGRLNGLRRLLTLETADGRNAWYEAKLGAREVGTYALDVAAALRAVQELPLDPDVGATVSPRLGDEYLYALLLTSLNSLAATVPPALLGALVRNDLLTTTDALIYARRTTDPIQRAEALIRLLPALDETERLGTFDELVREIEASEPEIALAEQSELLASLVPHAGPAEVTRIVELLIDLLEEADRKPDSAYRVVDAVGAVASHLTPAQARRLFELASRSSDELVRDGVLPVIAQAADVELLGRVLAAARQISFTRRRASVLVELAPRLPPEERTQLLREAAEAALAWKSPDQLVGMVAEAAPSDRKRLLEAAIDAARHEKDPDERAVVLLQAAAHVDVAEERDRLVDEALEAAESLATGHIFTFRLVSLAQRARELPRPAGTRLLALVLAAARATYDGSERVDALAELTDHADDRDRDALLAEAFAAFREIGPILQPLSLEQLAPRLPADLLREALRIVQTVRDDDDRREALAALSPYLLRSRTNAQVAKAVTAARAVRHTPKARDILIALAGQVGGAQRASVLDAALDLAQEDGSTSLWGLALLAPSLDYADSPEVRAVWERAVGLAAAIDDPAYRASALRALAVNVGPHAQPPASSDAPDPRRVLADSLLASRAIDDQTERAVALALIASHLPDAERERALEEASHAAWALVERHTEARRRLGSIAQGMPVNALAIVAAHLGAEEGHELAREVVKSVRRLTRRDAKASALATVAACYREPHRSRLLREALAAARGEALKNSLATLALALPEPDRSAALAEALPEARDHDGYDLWTSITSALAAMPPEAAYRVLRNPPGGLATLPRRNVLTEIQYTAPVIFAIGGRSAVDDIAAAIQQTARWWP